MLNTCGFGSFFDSSVSSVSLKEVLHHQQACVPLSVFNENGDLGISSSISQHWKAHILPITGLYQPMP